MKCPHCSADEKTIVKETRKVAGDIARRRECLDCGQLFTTREFHDPDFVLTKPRPKREEAKPRTNNDDLFKAWGRK